MAHGSAGDKNGMSPMAMPEPTPRKAGLFRIWLWALAACGIIACAAFWLTRAPEEKKELKNQAADQVNKLLSETPIAGMGDILREAPPPPPIHTYARAGLPGTLSGPVVRGGVGNAPEGQDKGTTVYFSSDYVAPVKEDAKVRPGHVSDIANWLVGHYKPGPGGGSLQASVQGLNARGGSGLAAQATGGRAALLRYAFKPAMIEGLYRLYVDRFMDDLNVAAKNRGFSARENRQFHLALARQAAILAQALEATATTPDLSGHLARIDGLSQRSVELNSQMGVAVAEFDELRQANAPAKQLETVQLRINGLAARYRRSLEELANAKNALVAELRKGAGQGLDDESLLYVASWVERRLNNNSGAAAAVNSAAGAMRDLARRCAESGG